MSKIGYKDYSRREEILIFYAKQRKYSAREIARFLKVSERTVWNMLKRLKQKGYQIYCQDSVFCLDGEFPKSKFVFTEREKHIMSSIIDGYVAYVYPFFEHPEYIKSILGVKEYQKIIYFASYPKSALDLKRNNILHQIYTELTKTEGNLYTIYNMSYKKPGAQEPKEYIVAPLYILYKRRAWYIAAYDIKDSRQKLFRVNRIEKVEKTHKKTMIIPILPEEVFKNAWDFIGGEDTQKVVIKVLEEKIWAFLTEVKWHESQKDNTKDRTVEFRVHQPVEMIPFLLQFCGSIEILEPDFLKELYIQKLQRGLKLHFTEK